MAASVLYDDVEVGAAVPEQSFPVQRVDLVKYAGASGDFNVIHWNERVARSVGLPNVIAHGMFTMAENVSLAPYTHFFFELNMVSFYNIFTQLVGGERELYSADFSYPEPPWGHIYRRYFRCPVRFNQPVTCLRGSADEKCGAHGNECAPSRTWHAASNASAIAPRRRWRDQRPPRNRRGGDLRLSG